MIRAISSLLLIASLSASEAPLGHAKFEPSPEHPVGWRGDGTGVFPGATPSVRSWDHQSGAGILWKADVPWWSTASPIVVGDTVITTCDPHTVLAYHAVTGKLLWYNATDHLSAMMSPAKAAKVREDYAALVKRYNEEKGSRDDKQLQKDCKRFNELGFNGIRNRAQGHTWPTPLSDGESVYVAFGCNSMARYALADGKLIWMKQWGPIKNAGNGLKPNVTESQTSSWAERWVPSPLLVDGLLIGYQGAVMRAADAKTGNLKWTFNLSEHIDAVWGEHDKKVRRKGPTGHWGCATPVQLDLDGVKVVVTGQGSCIRVKDGKLLNPYVGAMATTGGNSPVADDKHDIVYFIDRQEGGGGATTDETWAIQLTRDGDKVTGKVLWHNGTLTGNAGSPLLVNGYLYDRGLKGVDALTGKSVFDGSGLKGVGGGYATPNIGGKFIYTFNSNAGSVIEVAANGSLKVVGRGTLQDPDSGKSKNEKAFTRHLQYRKDLLQRAKQGVKDGIIPYIDRLPTHGDFGTYGSSAFFHGDRVYVRTRMALYCLGKR